MLFPFTVDLIIPILNADVDETWPGVLPLPGASTVVVIVSVAELLMSISI